MADRGPDAGGRPRSPRRRVDLGARAATTTGAYRLRLRNMSTTGAMAEGEEVPPVGRDLILELEGMEIFCTTIWSVAGRCGVAFDAPLSQAAVVALSRCLPDARAEARAQQLAARAWACPEGRSAFLD